MVVDIVGYRRNGHNELDDPRVTLPLSYKRIAGHPPVLDLYAARLQQEGVVSEEELQQWRQQVGQVWMEGDGHQGWEVYVGSSIGHLAADIRHSGNYQSFPTLSRVRLFDHT